MVVVANVGLEFREQSSIPTVEMLTVLNVTNFIIFLIFGKETCMYMEIVIILIVFFLETGI